VSSTAEIEFTRVPAAEAADPRLRAQLLATWVAVTNAGGAVGFTAPADHEEIAETLDSALERVVAGTDALGVLRHDGAAVGMGLLVASRSVLRQHWRTVLRVMVHPDLQGQGAGRVLLTGLHGIAADLRLEQLNLSVRGGTGTERFYERFGYAVFGRNPGAIRLAPGDDRDEILMFKRL